MNQKLLEKSRKKLQLNEEIVLLELYIENGKRSLNSALYALVNAQKHELRILPKPRQRVKQPAITEVLDYAVLNETTFWSAFIALSNAKAVQIDGHDPRNWLNVTHS